MKRIIEGQDYSVYSIDFGTCKAAEMIVPCADGYTIYINSRMSDAKQLEAYEHALRHIRNNDFGDDGENSVDEMEIAAHG